MTKTEDILDAALDRFDALPAWAVAAINVAIFGVCVLIGTAIGIGIGRAVIG